jgi:hypothetical protein
VIDITGKSVLKLNQKSKSVFTSFRDLSFTIEFTDGTSTSEKVIKE